MLAPGQDATPGEVFLHFSSRKEPFGPGTPSNPSQRGERSLNAIQPGDKLVGAAGRRVALDVRLRGAIHGVEHHQAVLGPSILRWEGGHGDLASQAARVPQNTRPVTPRPPPGPAGAPHPRLTSPPKSVSAGGPPLKYLRESEVKNWGSGPDTEMLSTSIYIINSSRRAGPQWRGGTRTHSMAGSR